MIREFHHGAYTTTADSYADGDTEYEIKRRGPKGYKIVVLAFFILRNGRMVANQSDPRTFNRITGRAGKQDWS